MEDVEKEGKRERESSSSEGPFLQESPRGGSLSTKLFYLQKAVPNGSIDKKSLSPLYASFVFKEEGRSFVKGAIM